MLLLIKAFLGALIVVLIDIISRSKKFYALSGLLPLFPTFALIAHILVYSKQGEIGVKNTALFGMLSIIPYMVYLLGVYFFVEKFNFFITLLLALVLWFIAALFISYIYFHFVK
jgi:membrane protein GlpM